MRKKLSTLTVITVTAITVLALSATAWGAPAYGSAEWYLNYMQKYSTSLLTPSQPSPTPTPNPTPDPNPIPAPNPTPTPKPNPTPSYPSNPQQNPNWYLDYLNQYQSTRPSSPTPSTPAPQPTPTPNLPVDKDPEPEQPPASLTAEEQQLLSYINQERAKVGAAPVTVDPELVRVARLRADKLIELDSYEHNIPGYGTAGQQLTREGYKYAYLGENLAAAGSVYQAHANLMRSSSHKAIMLDPKFTKVGIGISHYTGNKSGIMAIELFAQPN